jgi:vancomycin permeability regulator SanA
MFKTRLFGLILGLCMFFSMTAVFTAQAQLVLSNQRLKIVQVERKNNRIQARVHETNKGNIQYIIIDGDTKFSHKDKEITYDEAWAMFKPDMIIRVKGGVTLSGQIKAKSIYW